MPGAKVRVLGEEEGLEVVGYGQVVLDGNGDLAAPIDVLGPASIAELRRALTGFRYRGETIWITEVSQAEFGDPDYAPREDVEISFLDGAITATAYYVPAENVEPDPSEIEQVLRPLLARVRAEIDSATPDEQGGVHLAYVGVKFKSDRSRTVFDLYTLGKNVLELLAAADGASLRRETTADLLRAGRVDLLVGQPENEWLEAKRSPYTNSETAKFELAKDVAAFANAGGGLIVVGVATSRRGDRDVLAGVHPFPIHLARPSSLRRVIDHRVHPPVQGLEIVHVPYGGGPNGIVVISIPPQSEEMQPFLVRGAVINGRFTGSFVSIFTRRDEDVLPTDIASVHALLAAGRAALRTRRSRRDGD